MSRAQFSIALVVLAVAALLVGCGSKLKLHSDSLRGKAATHSAFADLPYQTITERTRFDIEPTSPTFDFDEGRSHFVAIVIPEDTPAFLDVTSRPIGQWVPTTHLFAPVVLFLDGDHALIHKRRPALIHNPRFMKGLDFDGQVAIPDGARYAVLHALPYEFGKVVSLFGKKPGSMETTYTMTQGLGLVIVTLPDFADSSTIGPTGRIWLSFNDQPLRLPVPQRSHRG
jgi:hypothetical protein